MFRRIAKARIVGERVVALTYSDGATVEVDFVWLIAREGVWATLTDATVFAQLSMSDDGRSIAWPGELDFAPTRCGRLGRANSAVQADSP